MSLLNYTTIAYCFLLFGCNSESKKSISVHSINAKEQTKKIEIKSEKINIINTDNDNAEKLFIPADILDSTVVDLSKLISHIQLTPLETTPKSIFGKVNKILSYSNFYFVHDKRNNKLLRFSHEGKFLNSIGVIGKGPQELISIWDVAINEEKKFISILDAMSKKISKFTFEGKYIGSQPLFYIISQHEYGNNSLVFGVSKVQRNIQIPVIDSYSLILADTNSIPCRIAFENPKKSNSYFTINPLRKFDNNIYYHHPYSDGIWKVQDTLLIPIMKFEFEKNGIPNDAWTKNINTKEFKDILSKYSHFSGNYIVTDKFCFFKIYGNRKVSNLFFNRKTKSLIYGGGFKYSADYPLTILFNTPIGCKKDGSFFALKQASQLLSLKNHVKNNEELKNSFKSSDWEKIMKVQESDNPIIITYKLKDF